MLFYDVRPLSKNVAENDLIGTWKFKPTIENRLFAKPSIIILKKDGCYEIHNPPIWLRKMCKPPTKIFISETCEEIIIGNWFFAKKGMAGVSFVGIDGFGGYIIGKRAPYQLHYCRIAPDVTPLRRWQWVSKEIQCPLCQKNNTPIREIKEPIYEFDTYDPRKLELEESEYSGRIVAVIGIIIIMVIFILLMKVRYF